MKFKAITLPHFRREMLNKTLFVMKLTFFLMLVGFLQVAAKGLSQEVSLSEKGARLQKILKKIHKQTGYLFWYDIKEVGEAKPVDIQVERVSIEKALSICFNGQPLSYTIINKTVVVKSLSTPPPLAADPPPTPVIPPPVDISGKIIDPEGKPVPGVSIKVKGSNKGTFTAADGTFTLTDVGDNAELEISSVGFTTQTIAVGKRKQITISLAFDVREEETVVISYGTQKKATLTGAIATVKGDDIRRSPATNISNNLVGRLPGLSVVTPGGEPGTTGATIRIRGSNTLGNNSPLVVVDGIANRPLERINPADIESITVLKDAMAAIYGAQAANGVILVTTKRGKTGKPKITVDFNHGYNQPTRIPKMADAAQYATMLNEISYYANPGAGRNQRYTDDDIRQFSDGSDPWGHPNTDWFGEVFKKWSPQTYGNVTLSGGSDNFRYLLSIGARTEDGYYKNSATKYDQYNFRTNIDGKISKSISVSFDVSGRQEVANFPTVSSVGIFRALMRGKPNRPAFWPDGSPGPELEFGDQPAVTSTNATGYDKDKWYRLESRVNITFNVPWVKGLTIQGNASIDKAIESRKVFITPWYLYTWDGNPDHILNKGKKGVDAPQLTQINNDGQTTTLNAYATYEREINTDHHIKIMAGTERQEGNNSYFTAFRRNYLSAEIDQLFAGASDEFMSNNGLGTQSARLNYFGRLNYDYKLKYLFEYVWRYDGSYIFPKDKRFGFFQGVSLGWRISEENFWKENLSFIDGFKIRGTYGQTGNDRIAEYQYLSSYGFQNQPYILGTDHDNKRLVELRVPNPEVTWEVAEQANIGFDMQLLRKKLTIEADYFINRRSNILTTRNGSVPGSTGFTLPPENIGKVSNKGFEITVGYGDQAGDFGYNISVNGSYSKNKIVFWDETPGVPEYQQSTGRPMGSNLYYNAIGIFKDQADVDKYPHWAGAKPGDVIFEDVNGDNKIDGLDLVRNERNALPRFTGGFNLSLIYKNFQLTALVQGAAGAQQYVRPESGDDGNYYKDFAENRWTPENPGATYPRTFNGSNEYWRNQLNTYWIQSTDYMRLKSLEISYNVPLRKESKNIQALRVYLNGLNLLTIDKGTLIDPESMADQLGINYPPQRIVNAGVSITF